jgi:hypothetical protein
MMLRTRESLDRSSGAIKDRGGTLQALRDVVHHSRGERTSCTRGGQQGEEARWTREERLVEV